VSFVLAFNPTDGPVIIDIAGRSLGGGEWGAIDITDDIAKDALDTHRLVRPAEPGKGANPEALRAHKRAQALSARQGAFDATEKEQLQSIAVHADLIGPDGDLSKTELVALLVHSSVDIPTAANKPAQKE
jgi:hypothetical protein